MELSDRNIGLDEEHSFLVMQKIGQYHAASMVIARDVSRSELISCYGFR